MMGELALSAGELMPIFADLIVQHEPGSIVPPAFN